MGGGGNRACGFAHKNLKPYFLCLISIFCIHWGIASYQPFIDTALILLCGGIIAIIIDNNGNLKTSLYKSRFLIISVALSAISYKITLDILKKLDIVRTIYNNQMTPLSDFPNRILQAIETSFKHLFIYNESFMPMSMSICFVLFVAILFTLLINTKISKSAKMIITILFVAMVVASQTHIILSKEIRNGILIEYYGLLFLRVLIVALVFKCIAQFVRTQVLLQSLAFALSCVFIWICVVQDLEAQKVHKLAMDRDFRLINRIVDRIEQSEGFSYNKQYNLIMFGEVQNKTTKDFMYNLFPHFQLKPVLAYNMPKDIVARKDFYSNLSIEYYKDNKEYISGFYNIISRLHKAKILDKLKPFPHKDSIVIFEDIIVFVAGKGDLDKIRHLAKTLDDKGVLQ